MNVQFTASIIILGLMTLLFGFAQWKKDNSVVDIFWGIGFCLVAVSTLVLSGNFSARPLIVTGLVLLWGIRLSLYIGKRNAGKEEDFRYDEMRKRWGKHQAVGAFLNVFLLQGILMLIISLSVQMINIHSISALNFIDLIGILLWSTGFYFEAAGDAQLKNFKSDPQNKGRIMKTGLWSKTRHPNYFGEATMWWGIFLISLNVPYWYLSLAGTLLITFFLMKVSGVPLLEKKYKDNPEYQEYIKSTPAFFPKII